MAAHRYWRITFTSAAGSVFSFAEVQFRTSAGVSLAFATGSASASEAGGGTTAANGGDGNTATNWASNSTTSGIWWQWDFASGHSLDPRELWMAARNDASFNQAPTVFSVFWSDDGVFFNLLTSFTGVSWTGAGQSQTFALPASQPANTSVSRLSSYAIVKPLPGVNVVRLNSYTLVVPSAGVNVLRLNSYIVLMGSDTTLLAAPPRRRRRQADEDPPTVAALRRRRARSGTGGATTSTAIANASFFF